MLRKAIRTAQVYFPSLVNAKFALNEIYCRRFGHLFKPEFGGLYWFASKWEGRLLIDVGAHRGRSIAACQIAVPDCRIVAFEANPDYAHRLKVRYDQSQSVAIESCALMDVPGSLRLHIPSYNDHPLEGVSSTDRQSILRWFNIGQFYFADDKKLEIRSIDVTGKTLDSFGLDPVFIKLHIQRAELQALKGAEKTVTKYRPVLLVAYPWSALIDYLKWLGYKPFAYRERFFIPDTLGTEFTWFLLPEHDVPMGERGDHWFPDSFPY